MSTKAERRREDADRKIKTEKERENKNRKGKKERERERRETGRVERMAGDCSLSLFSFICCVSPI